MNDMHYRKPTQFDNAPFKTIWKHLNEVNTISSYIQTCIDPEEPQWVAMGDFLVESFKPFLNNEAFIDECLKLFNKDFNKTFYKMIKLMSSDYEIEQAP